MVEIPALILRDHVQNALRRYWPVGREIIESLPVVDAGFPQSSTEPDYVLVVLPDWANSCGVDRALLVPRAASLSSDSPKWREVDWWLAAFLMLECWPERNWEQQHEPIHSFSSRLPGWDARVWGYAWVNRIALFLRAWAAHEAASTPEKLFGPVPQAKILMTHDVDAVAKTFPIRLKQSAFNMFNAGRHAAKGELGRAVEKIRSAARFFCKSEDWWVFDNLLDKEQQLGICAQFNFYADAREKTIKRWFFDPGYDIADKKIRQLMTLIVEHQGIIGLHPTYDSWDSPVIIRAQRERLAKMVGQPVTRCRQHWLRFSWSSTWTAQENAGLEIDTTLMFNDRPGFRAAAALAWHPWNQSEGLAHGIKALPTVLMDSQCYDYQTMAQSERRRVMKYWLDEIRFVGGEAAVLWHPHTLVEDYGWGEGFRELLNIMTKYRLCQNF